MRKFDFNLCNFSVKRMGVTLSTLLVTMLATTMVSCEPNECPNVTPRGEEEGNTNSANGMQIVLEIEDENGTVRTVSGDSNYSFTELGKGGTVQVKGTGFQPTQDRTNKVNVNLTFYAQENVVFQGWSWRYEEDPKGTHRKVHESTLNDFIPTPAIQVESGVQMLDIKQEDTSFTCYYHPERSNKVYVKVKYAKTDLSNPTYHWNVGKPLITTTALLDIFDGLFKSSFRHPFVVPITSYVTFKDVKTATGEYQKIPLPPRPIGGLYHELTSPIPDKNDNGLFYVVVLRSQNNLSKDPLKIDLEVRQPSLRVNGRTNWVNIGYIPVTLRGVDIKQLSFQGFFSPTTPSPQKAVAIRHRPDYLNLLLFKGNKQGSHRYSQITINFRTSDGQTYKKAYSLGDEKGGLVSAIDLLPDLIAFGRRGGADNYLWDCPEWDIDFHSSNTFLGDQLRQNSHSYWGHETLWFDYKREY